MKCPAVLGTVLLFIALSAWGQFTIVNHYGATDPVAEGFNPEFSDSPQIGPVTDSGTDAWMTAVNGSGVSYNDFEPDFYGVNWTFSITLKIVSATPPGIFSANVLSGSRNFILYFGANTAGDPMVQISGAQTSAAYTLNGMGAVYNTFEVAYSASTDSANLYANGNLLAANLLASDTAPRASFVSWGAYDSSQTGPFQADWSNVSFAVPEPSSYSLILFGSLAWAISKILKQNRNVIRATKNPAPKIGAGRDACEI